MTQAGLGWLFETADTQVRAHQFFSELQTAEQYYRQRYGNETDMLATMSQDSGRYRALIESFGLPLSFEMRAIIFRILAESVVIRELFFTYSSESGATLSIRLSNEPDENAPPISCNSPWDPIVLQQLSMMESEGKLLIGSGIRPWLSDTSREESL